VITIAVDQEQLRPWLVFRLLIFRFRKDEAESGQKTHDS
jgi:hypothetical protein